MRMRQSSGGGPFARFIFLRSSEVDKMCEDALKAAGKLPEEPERIDIEGFIEAYLGARLDFGTDLGADVLGFTFFSPTGKPEVIGVSPHLDEGTQVSDRRIRATLAHEAGHALIHPVLFMEAEGQQQLFESNVDLANRRILCRRGDINPNGRYDGRWWEYQANCAIGGFLLPKRLVLKCVENYSRAAGPLGGYVLSSDARSAAEQRLAEVFEVNPVVARIRLKSLLPESDQPELLGNSGP